MADISGPTLLQTCLRDLGVQGQGSLLPVQPQKDTSGCILHLSFIFFSLPPFLPSFHPSGSPIKLHFMTHYYHWSTHGLLPYLFVCSILLSFPFSFLNPTKGNHSNVFVVFLLLPYGSHSFIYVYFKLKNIFLDEPAIKLAFLVYSFMNLNMFIFV